MSLRFLFFALLLSYNIISQTKTVSELNFESIDSIRNEYRTPENTNFLFVSSKFGSEEVIYIPGLDSINHFQIKKIVLVYSEFHKKEKFDQTKLNEKRWAHLLKSYPAFFESGITKYQNVCQYGIMQDSSAKKLTHGFYIYFENPSDEKKRESEITEINKMLGKLGVDIADTSSTDEPYNETGTETEISDKKEKGDEVVLKGIKSKKSKFPKPMRTKDPKACRKPFYEKGNEDLSLFFEQNITLSKKQKRKNKKLEAEVRLKLDYNGTIRSVSIWSRDKKLSTQIAQSFSLMNAWNPAIRNGVTIRSEVKFKLKFVAPDKISLNGEIGVARNVLKCDCKSNEELFDFSKEKMAEKLIPHVFEVADGQIMRNVIERNPSMDSLLVVVDLTGSMGPYIAQVLDLMADLVTKDNPHVSGFSLFNDGNKTSDSKKVIGKTGGIYIVKEDVTLDKLGKTIVKSMKNGFGGDCPENNIEAVLKGMEECPAHKDILMVADNNATPRDANIVAAIKKPMHWILCGVFDEINVDYLKIIRENKGFLHTTNSDVINLHLLKENEVIKIDGITYQLSKNKFRIVKMG